MLRKKRFLFAFFFFLSVVVSGKTVLEYDFSKAKDGKVPDLSGNGFDLTLGKTTLIEPGPSGQSLKFDGMPESVCRGDTNAFKKKIPSLDEASGSIWVKFDKYEQNLELGGFACLQIDPEMKTFKFNTSAISSPINYAWPMDSHYPVKLGEWHQIAFVYSATKGYYAFYIDGELQAEMHRELAPLGARSLDFGANFTGGLGAVKICDKVLDKEELFLIKVAPEEIAAQQALLSSLSSGELKNQYFSGWCASLQSELGKLKAKPSCSAKTWSVLKNNVAKAGKIVAGLEQLDAKSFLRNSPLLCYVVPPVSSEIRVPQCLPLDGKLSDEVRIVAARGEFEPGSFVLFPFQDFKKIELEVSALKDGKNSIPAAAVDLRVVKCWYQNGNAWYSYFSNQKNRTLIPELLLKDEKLVKVDEDSRSNYLRVDYPSGSEYLDISFTTPEKDTPKFNYGIEPVRDAKILQPVEMRTGRCQQFWITVKVPEEAAEGVYNGTLKLLADGKALGEIRLALRVLPFQLPSPKTHYDLTRDYYVVLFNHCSLTEEIDLTKNQAAAEKRMLAEFKNMKDHNALHPFGPCYRNNREFFVRQLELMKESGLPCRPLWNAVSSANMKWILAPDENRTPDLFEECFSNFKKLVDEAFDLTKKTLGHCEVYCYGFDEATSYRSLAVSQPPFWQYIQSKGGKIVTSGWDNNYKFVGYIEDAHLQASVIDQQRADRWHAVGGRILSYASPFSGPENPELFRRNKGLRMYKANYDGPSTYQYYEGHHIWNEFLKGARYRNFNLVYPSIDGVIDTIAWEGYREGIDDVRYATLLKMLAAEAMQSKSLEIQYEGKKAIVWLELLDELSENLDTVRLEMIEHIMGLRKILGK